MSPPQKKTSPISASPGFEPTTFLIQASVRFMKRTLTPKTTVPWLNLLWLFRFCLQSGCCVLRPVNNKLKNCYFQTFLLFWMKNHQKMSSIIKKRLKMANKVFQAAFRFAAAPESWSKYTTTCLFQIWGISGFGFHFSAILCKSASQTLHICLFIGKIFICYPTFERIGMGFTNHQHS